MESRIKIRRTSIRKTRKELGAESGVSAKSIQQYEDGLRSPSPGVLLNIARALGVSVAWLKGETEDPYVDDSIRIGEYQKSAGKSESEGMNVLRLAADVVDLGLAGGIGALVDMVQREFDRRGEGGELLDLLELHIRRARERATTLERMADRLEELQAEEKGRQLDQFIEKRGRR